MVLHIVKRCKNKNCVPRCNVKRCHKKHDKKTSVERDENLVKEIIRRNQKQESDFLLLLNSKKSNKEIKTESAKPQKQREAGGVDCNIEGTPFGKDGVVETPKFPKEVRIKIQETHHFPNSVHGVVRSTFPDGRKKTGTGIVIGPSLVLTAAHNLFDNNNQKGEVEFIPGINGKTAPFDVFKISSSYCPENWEDDDYALMVTRRAVGLETGYFGLHIAEKTVLSGKKLNIVGYPAYVRNEKGESVTLSGEGNHQQWSDKGDLITSEDDYLTYQIFTTPGQSGSGVFYHEDKTDAYYIIGIHVLKSGDKNCATWITKKRFKQIESWISDYNAKKISGNTAKTISNKVKTQDFKHLVKLSLLDMHIGKEEARILANLDMKNLRFLFLSDGSLEAEGEHILDKALPNCRINLVPKNRPTFDRVIEGNAIAIDITDEMLFSHPRVIR